MSTEPASPAVPMGRLTGLIPFLWAGLVITAGAATWLSRPRWWTWIAPEASLAREINTGLLLATSGIAAWLWWRRSADRRIMALLALGFFALAFDERLAIHERLRDRVLAPRNVKLPFIPWGEPGDIVLVVVAMVGLAVLGSVLRAMDDEPVARRWFVAGVVLAVVAVGLDTLPIETYQLSNEIYFQSGEEAIELVAAGCFCSAALTWADGRVAA